MMDYTSRNAGLSLADAYVEASATGNLSKRDKDIIKAYLARRTLIEAFSEETVGGAPPLLVPGSFKASLFVRDVFSCPFGRIPLVSTGYLLPLSAPSGLALLAEFRGGPRCCA